MTELLCIININHRQFWETAELLFLPTDKSKQAVALHLTKFFNRDYSFPSLVLFEKVKYGTIEKKTKLED
jgi:hypothetical protein